MGKQVEQVSTLNATTSNGQTTTTTTPENNESEEWDQFENTMTQAGQAMIKVASMVPFAAQAAAIADQVLAQVGQVSHNRKYVKYFVDRVRRHQEALAMHMPEGPAADKAYQHYIEVLNEISAFIEEMKHKGTTFTKRAILKIKTFLNANDIAASFDALKVKLEEAMKDFQLSETLDICHENEIRVQQEQEALEKIKSAIPGQGQLKEIIIGWDDLDNDDDDDDDGNDKPIVRGDIVKKLYGVQTVAVKKIGPNDDSHNKIINKRIEFLLHLEACEHVERFIGKTIYQNNLYLITNWAENSDLESFLRSEPNIDWYQKTLWGEQLAGALQFCHKADILHHDLKTKNILLDEYLTVKLSNFGSSRYENDATTSVNDLLASIRWTAPEKLKQTDEFFSYSRRCEIYSYGIVLWEIATAKTPFFEITSDIDVAEAVLKGKRPTPIPEDTPYKDLMKDCWAKKGVDRPDIHQVQHKMGVIRKKLPKPDN